MITNLATSSNEFAAIVGTENLRTATSGDAIDGVQPQIIVEPRNAEDVSRVLKYANENNLRVAPRGGGTKTDWGNAPRGVDLILSTKLLNRIVEHAWGDMTATVEAGCTIAEFQKTLAEHGQCFALDAMFAERATIGGILATNDSGALRVRFGALRDLVIGVTVVLPDGTIARSGGKVVKNVAGYDLPKLLTGALGTLGVITEATFRLYPLARETRTLSFQLPTIEAANKLTLAIQDSTLAPTGVQLRAGSNETPQVDVRFEGAALDAPIEQLLRLAANAGQLEESNDVWNARESLWHETQSAMVCKISVLPAQIAFVCEALNRIAASKQINWRACMQAIGLGTLRIDASGNAESLFALFENLRDEIRKLDGSLVILRCPFELKKRVDVWGDGGDALALLRRVKKQFDPRDILNPGRFIGGI